jgi:hypothetical protein
MKSRKALKTDNCWDTLISKRASEIPEWSTVCKVGGDVASKVFSCRHVLLSAPKAVDGSTIGVSLEGCLNQDLNQDNSTIDIQSTCRPGEYRR